MNQQDQKFFEECEQAIQNSYESSVTMEEAEKLAAKFLHAQIKAGNVLRQFDLDARMRKSGLKAIKAKAYSEECSRYEKKPTEAAIESAINQSGLVNTAQDELDTAEVDRDALANYLHVFREAHVYYRGIAKGSYNG